MELNELLANYLNGEPLHDAVAIGIIITIVFEFYKVIFSTIFGLFK